MWFIPLLRALANAVVDEDTSAKSGPWPLIREADSPLEGMPSSILIVLAFGCLALAAAVAGLTLGLMSLDSTALDIVMQSNNPAQAAAARVIKPVREQGNLLLVTLLLTNTLAAELLPLVLEALYPGGYFSLIVSVFSLMLFGEMIPQAVFSRHPLYFGRKLIGFVRVLRFVMYPIAAPIAYALDSLLGEELGTIYNRDELKGLIDVHANNKILTRDETTILKAALEFSLKTVDQILTPAKNVFKLSIDTRLDRNVLLSILRSGHSRIPLYDQSPNDIVCLLLVKQLLLVNPETDMPIRALISSRATSHKIRVAPAVECSANTHIPDLLNEFQTGRTHMALIYDDVKKPLEEREFLGIVSIEDIIEEILQEEIIDETDMFIDNVSRTPVLVRNTEGQLVRAKALSANPTAHPATPSASESLRIKEIDVRALRAPLQRNPSRDGKGVTAASLAPQNANTTSMSFSDFQNRLSSDAKEDDQSGINPGGASAAKTSSVDSTMSAAQSGPLLRSPAKSAEVSTAGRSMMSLLGDDDNILPEDLAQAQKMSKKVFTPRATDKVKVRPLPLDASSEREEIPARLRRRGSKKAMNEATPATTPVPKQGYGSINDDGVSLSHNATNADEDVEKGQN